MEQEFASQLLEGAVTQLSRLPGIGRATALRLVMHLLRQPVQQADELAEAITHLCHDVHYCSVCHNICDDDICPICANAQRDHHTICVVEDPSHVISIERTAQHRGLYHVLYGLISPIDGIGPHDIHIDSLVKRVEAGDVREVILALSPTPQGDTTAFYIYRRLQPFSQVRVTTLARGVSLGNELQYTDQLTLARSISSRLPYSDTLNQQQ